MKRLEPLTVDQLLARFSSDPREALTLFSMLYRYPNGEELQEAIETDGRFRAPLLRVVAAFKDSDKVCSWMYHRLPKDPDLVPVLVDVWRAWRGETSHGAELVLRELGDRRGLEAMAGELGKTPPTYRVGPIDATMRLHVDTAYDRVAAMLVIDPGALWIVLGFVTEEHIAADARWAELAIGTIDHPDRNTRRRARAIVDTMVPDRRRPANKPPKPADPAAIDTFRSAIADLVAKLPTGGFTRARANAETTLDELERLTGYVPAAVRAFYERIDSITIARGKPRDAFVVVSLAEVSSDAKRWTSQNPRPGLTTFVWPVTPDGATKSGFSGGEAYGFDAPTDDDDPVLNLPKRPTFMKFVTGAARLRNVKRSKRGRRS